MIPSRPNARGVDADLTAADWLEAIPSDRPAVIVADCLTAFLTLDQLASLLNRLVDRLPEVAEFPTTLRLYNRLLTLSTGLSRKGTIVLHYSF